jgi:very-short-patch-repair endonuclease/DNA polymerase III delta prime subunit
MSNVAPIVTSRVLIQCELVPKLNFACHQNAFPVLRKLELTNQDSEAAISHITVTLESNPAFLKPKVWHIDTIAPGGSVIIRDRDIQLDGNFLMNLTDSMRGSIQIRVESDEETIAEISTAIELLAYNEWGGSAYMPELLAAFVTPNDPVIDRILKEASQILQKAGKPDGIDGYQSGSRQRVWEMVSAIYSAVANLKLTYAEPPASFESNGQKIRMAGQILEGGLATCLDTAILFASVFEQAGLNPVVALPQGHAIVGVWLQPEEFSTIITDEAEMLRKRVQLKELVLFETTFVTSYPAPPFSRAAQRANEIISEENDSTFRAAVDIKQARSHQIKPLGLKSTTIPDTPQEHSTSPSFEQPLEEAPVLPDFDVEMEEPEDETPAGRLERWQRKLLDLTLTNRLLNHKAEKSSLKLICPDPGLLEDRLADGKKIAIQPVPRPIGTGQDESIHRQRTGQVISQEYARDAIQKDQVLVDLDEAELSKRVVEIYRKTQTALQEGGANTLYLALGFLLWKKEEKDERRFRAPLILVPVSLERKSVRSGVKLVLHDDEPRFNTTLLEMFRRDFNLVITGLDGELPKDASGIDVAKVWNKVRVAVKDTPGFEVVEDVVLGHFSFAKYLMWKDLVDRTEQLRGNPVVAHLIDSPRDPYPSKVDFVEPKELDRQYKPADLLVPLPADSSQIATIASAERGKDFVIFGPPGTGKSQTITNLISHLLGKGKTVLFVSEKTAALEVVYRRLRDIGLSQFCLELHSNKAKKTDVLNQLRSAWDSAAEKTEQEWTQQAKELETLRDKLNRFVTHLHKKHPNGLTPYQAMGVKIKDASLAGCVIFSWLNADCHDKETLSKMRLTVEQLGIQARSVGNITDSPFSFVASGDWSPQWESDIVAKATRLSSSVAKASESCQTLCQAIGLTLPDHTLTRLEALATLSGLLKQSHRKQGAYALEADGADRIESLEEAILRLKTYAKAQASLSCQYEPESWRQLDGEDIGNRWQLANQTWWPKSFFAKRAVINEMKAKGALGSPDPSHDAPILVTLREEGTAIDALDKKLSDLRIWQRHTTEPEKVESLQILAQQIREITGKLADDVQTLTQLRQTIRALINEGNDLLASDATIGRASDNFVSSLEEFRLSCDAFEALAGQEIRQQFVEKDNALGTIQEAAERIISNHHDLRDWCAWRRARAEALDLDLKPMVEALERGLIEPRDISEVFEAAYCAWWSKAVITEDEVLRSFSTPEHVATIEKFKELDEKFQETTAEYVSAKLRSVLPSQKDVNRGSEWGILQREIQKQRQHKPVRQLMQEIPSVITKLAPCLMMSPLSIAQYLPASQALFDVVIFDEASQITVWDAVGALARGKQVIVAGDPKQMPPSNRFGRSDDGEDADVQQEGDLESILDEMLGASIPPLKLNWHYRSKRESLIAFSNHRYYDGTLVTFPAPTVSDKGVTLVKVAGEYARGAGRHNEIEARAIVKECVRRLTHTDEQIRGQSIGVVTFNTEQQSLIENLLDAERNKDPRIEWAFSKDNVTEPLFVKNLDTVQGDERDVILFSVTFGPDKSGHITMNFGDLNKQGGERRLNVALTRARSEMVVFSSLPSDRIDLSRTSAAAVADLKHFLEFAEKGPSILGSSVFGPQGDFESPFEIAVARALKDKGWQVHPQIGVSAYRIDLGIVHPDKPGLYLAGIECDGAAYHSSATAKDRDKIRQAVLERLGWKLYRIWSTDWWTNQPKALEDMHVKLTQLLQESRQEKAPPQPDPTITSAVIFPASNDLDELDDEEELFTDESEEYPPEELTESDGKPWTAYGVEELERIIVSVLKECPNYSCVKGDLFYPKQSDLTAKVCKQLGIRTRGTPRRLFGEEVFKAVKRLKNKNAIEEYKAKNDRLRLIQF